MSNIYSEKETLIKALNAFYSDTHAPGHVLYFTEDESTLIAEHLLEKGIIVPPCKVGTKTYHIFWNDDNNTWRVGESLVVEIRQRLGSDLEIIERHTNLDGSYTYSAVLPESLGKTVFYSKEKAEYVIRNLKKTDL